MTASKYTHFFQGLALVGVLALTVFPSWTPSWAEEADSQSSDQEANDDESKAEQTKTIQKIIEDSENVLAGRGFSYDPSGRRDPFRSLVEQTNDERGPRPQGIAGMLIAEVDLVGIVQKEKDNLAFFNGSDNKGYFLRVGDRLYDGRIIQIHRSNGEVVFRQEINDPRSIKPYRDITKRLYSAEEGRL